MPRHRLLRCNGPRYTGALPRGLACRHHQFDAGQGAWWGPGRVHNGLQGSCGAAPSAVASLPFLQRTPARRCRRGAGGVAASHGELVAPCQGSHVSFAPLTLHPHGNVGFLMPPKALHFIASLFHLVFHLLHLLLVYLLIRSTLLC